MSYYVISAHGLAGKLIDVTSLLTGSHKGYVKSYEPEAHDGRGDVTFTGDRKLALHFPDAAAAWKFLMQVPANRPLREDGQPNRPLRAFHIAIDRIDE